MLCTRQSQSRLLHNALLIHDDIEDGSEKRRGRPTLHLLHGVPLALNAGDTLTLMSFRPLLDNRVRIGERLTLRIIEETERMARECAEGQAMELGWRRYNTTEIGDADYLEMVLKKTCWLSTIYPIRVGALIGSRDSSRSESIRCATDFFSAPHFRSRTIFSTWWATTATARRLTAISGKASER